MKLAAAVTVLALLALPFSAAAAGTASGAKHAVVHAMHEEGDTISETRCRQTAPSRFSCSFDDVTRQSPGQVTVTYTHHRYYVGEPRFHPAPSTPPRSPCGVYYTC